MGLARLLPRPGIRTETAKGAPMGRVISFANQKGGVAKTTTTLNLGVALSEKGFKVLLVDLDPQGNLTMSQGLNPDTIEQSMFDVLVHRLPLEQVVATRGVGIGGSWVALAARPRCRSSTGSRPGGSTPPCRRPTSPAPTWRSRARSAASVRSRRRSRPS